MPSNSRRRLTSAVWLVAATAATVIGCAPAPSLDRPDTAAATTPSAADEKDAAAADSPSADDLSGSSTETPVAPSAPREVPAPQAATRPAGPRIAVGVQARESQYRSLANGQFALARQELGYFIDVHEARMRQALTNTTVRMERNEVNLRLTVPGGLSFAPGSAQINAEGRPVLARIAAVLSEFEKTLVSVHGHTDRSGDTDYNRRLSERRAIAVAEFLAQNGIARQRLVGIGHGEEQPAVTGDSSEARAANRRVEILIEPIINGSELAQLTR